MMISPRTTLQITQILQVQTLEFCLQTDWGSKSPDHSQKIHAHLKNQIQGNESSCSTSISHTEGFGGYVFLTREINEPLQIGFDLELKERLAPAIAERICQDKLEFNEAPSPAALWCAKEAAFKALKGPHQPQVLPEIKISNWRKNSQFETFQFSTTNPLSFRKTLGLSWTEGVYQVAVACVWF